MHVTCYCSKGGGAHLIFCQDFNVLHVTTSVSQQLSEKLNLSLKGHSCIENDFELYDTPWS